MVLIFVESVFSSNFLSMVHDGQTFGDLAQYFGCEWNLR